MRLPSTSSIARLHFGQVYVTSFTGSSLTCLTGLAIALTSTRPPTRRPAPRHRGSPCPGLQRPPWALPDYPQSPPRRACKTLHTLRPPVASLRVDLRPGHDLPTRRRHRPPAPPWALTPLEIRCPAHSRRRPGYAVMQPLCAENCITMPYNSGHKKSAACALCRKRFELRIWCTTSHNTFYVNSPNSWQPAGFHDFYSK
jgi:hypothetical protein